MQKIISGIFSLILLSPLTTFAQNEVDALRYGQVATGATALSLSLGGAGGSMGGDFSSLSINPAGIGVYRTSEIMFTPTLRFNNNKGTYLGTDNTDDNAKFNVSNFGIVFAKSASGRNYDKSDWKSFSIGIGYNRVADFNDRVTYTGLNKESSIAEIFSADARYNGIDQGNIPPLGFLGYEGFVLDNDYNSIVPYTDGLQQTKTIRSNGGIGEWVFSVGGNYREKLLLGATLGLQSYKYERDINFLEEDASGRTDNHFDYISYNEYLSTTGFGVNIKLGAIYVVNDMLKIGVAAHTPTWASFTDIGDYNVTTNTESYKADEGYQDTNPESFAQPQYTSQFNYNLRTPWRAVLSSTLTLGKSGMITADYEYVDYASMRYSMESQYGDYERSVNNAIKDAFTAGHNFRVGAEGRMKNFMGRLGFAYYTSPFRESSTFDGQRMDLSAGVGARFGAFFMDLAYVHSIYKVGDYGYPALVSGIPTGLADLKYGRNIVALTLGFKLGR